MRLCSLSATNWICLCGEPSANSRMLSVWSRYFKEKYIRNAGCMFHKANAKQITFWHSFGIISVPHALFAYRCGHNFIYKLNKKHCGLFTVSHTAHIQLQYVQHNGTIMITWPAICPARSTFWNKTPKSQLPINRISSSFFAPHLSALLKAILECSTGSSSGPIYQNWILQVVEQLVLPAVRWSSYY